MMDINEIRQYLPHRYPFLLVDRVTELVEGDRIVAYKNVTVNEPFFNGHFPDHPVMPGVLIIEAMAQAAGILGFKSMGKTRMDPSIISSALISCVLNVRLCPATGSSWKPQSCRKSAASGSLKLRLQLTARSSARPPFCVLIGKSDLD